MVGTELCCAPLQGYLSAGSTDVTSGCPKLHPQHHLHLHPTLPTLLFMTLKFLFTFMAQACIKPLTVPETPRENLSRSTRASPEEHQDFYGFNMACIMGFSQQLIC